MRAPLLLAAVLSSSIPAHALEVGSAPPQDFVARSRADPGRLYALIIGATWCHACKLLGESLTALAASSGTAVGRAVWNKVETDEYGAANFSAFMTGLRAPESQDLPSVLVLRGGEALGMSLAGNDLPKIEAFLAEAERQPARESRPPAKDSMLCPGKKDPASYTLGISGYMAPDDGSTDDFGRKVLLSFAPPGKRFRGRLFAPPRAGTSPGTESSRAPDGVFFTAADPIAGRAALLEDVAGSTSALAALASAPGRDLRLILTGHSGEEGMAIAFVATPLFKNDPANTYEKDVQLTPRDVADAVGRASRAGKRVRGLVTTCYAGRYADAFMPGDDPAAAPVCAAFATLPDKPADGCYSNGLSMGEDYASKLVALRSCASSEDGRALHYAVAASTTGHDIPMLSAEYFLLYGPGASFLGRGERAPAPPDSVQRYELPSGVRVYVDVISNRVLRAYQGDRRISPPRLALLDCAADDYSHSKLDRVNLTSSYLRPHKTGASIAQCTPYVSLYWEPGEGGVQASTSVFLEAGYDGWNPVDDWNGFRKDFEPGGPTIALDGMRPAARVLLAAVIPAFGGQAAAKDLGGTLDALAADLRPYDEPLAGALETLTAEQAGGVLRAPPPAKSVDSLAGVSGNTPPKEDPPGWTRHVLKPAPASGVKQAAPDADVLSDAIEAMPPIEALPAELAAPLPAADALLDFDPHAPPPPVEASALIDAMLDTLSPSRYEMGASLPRLAHVAAAAQAELALIRAAKASKEARRLLAQLKTIKTCERGLY
ncbi:MAG TPA: thioredoxin family protein [Elusimicrobiota bacterium]|nr:thioredoxin family protein [Elusimicrobiota bacterium]